MEPWWDPTPEQVAYAETTGQPLAIRNSHGQRFVLIPPGTFAIGQLLQEPSKAEMPHYGRHEVTLPQGFYIGANEVTNAEFRRFQATHDSGAAGPIIDERFPGGPLNGDLQPVVRVSWFDAQAYCRWLTATEQHAGLLTANEYYWLPSEIEWERACRAGTTTVYSIGDGGGTGVVRDRYMWYGALGFITWGPQLPPLRPGQSAGVTHPVAQKLSNPWGLYDMHGNAMEWTRSVWLPYPYGDDPERELRRDISPADAKRRLRKSRGRDKYAPRGDKLVQRGGSYRTTADYCSSWFRFGDDPDAREPEYGFRLIRMRTDSW